MIHRTTARLGLATPRHNVPARAAIGWQTRLMKAHVMIIAAFISLAALQSAVWAQKTPITSAAELPRRSYQLHGSIRQILEDREQLDRLARDLEKNLTADLEKFEIQDKATLVGYYSTLLSLALRGNDRPRAMDLIARIRELSGKYLDPNRMIWLVVGDAKTQLPRLKELGLGDPILIK